MNASNTKLDTDQKTILKGIKKEFAEKGGRVFSFPNSGMTVAIIRPFPGSKTFRVSTAYSSESEQKFRRKVGEYYAIRRVLWDAEFIVFPENYYNMQCLANIIGMQ